VKYQKHKIKLMKDPEFRKAYEDLGPEYQRRREEARLRVKNQLAFAESQGITVEQLVEELMNLFRDPPEDLPEDMPEEQEYGVAGSLANLLKADLTTEEWQKIIDEPYG